MKKARKTPTLLSAGKTGLIGLAAALGIGAALLGGCTSLPLSPPEKAPSPSGSSQSSVDPGSYDEVYQALASAFEKQGGTGGGLAYDVVTPESVAPLASAESSGLSAQSAGESHSDTNVQVEGIDEGDVVKTDGKDIYMASGADVVVIAAEGADTHEIARIAVNDDILNKSGLGGMVTPRELYVDGDTLVVLYVYSVYDPLEGGAQDSAGPSEEVAPYTVPTYSYRAIVEVACYDISDPHNPRFINTFGQDGNYVSSRLQDGVLSMVSTYGVYDLSLADQGSPMTYVPSYYTGASRQMIDYRDIRILPEQDSTSYSVITSLDVAKAQRIDEYSVLGAGDILYMSHDSLYLASGIYDNVETASYQDGSFTVTEYQETNSTRISKLSLNDGTIGFVADVLVPGTVLNQFALDEYEDCLRVVTTIDTSCYRTLDDGSGPISDYQSYESEPTTSALFVLDGQLRTKGSIQGLAEDERVYSVRFDGAVGYFVTFRQVDPLFAVDLSDPEDPQVKSELKIPGFSAYLQVYDTGRLFGLGMSADAQGRIQGMKMSMFDTTDPYNVTEIQGLALDDDYSEALYNHKAVIVDREKDLIGFPVPKGYVVYGYSEEQGFYLRQSFAAPEDSSYSAVLRGLYAGDYFYICSQGDIGVYALDGLAPVAQVPFEAGEADYYLQPYIVN